MIPAQPVTKTSDTQAPAVEHPKTLMGFLSQITGLKLGKEPTLHEYCFNAVFFSAGALMMIGVFH
jgi:hypothetical protein